MSGPSDQEKLGPREELVKRPGDTTVQSVIGVAEDDPDRPPELLQPGDHLVTRPDHGKQVHVQTKEGRLGTRCGVELLIKQRNEFPFYVLIPHEPPDLPP